MITLTKDEWKLVADAVQGAFGYLREEAAWAVIHKIEAEFPEFFPGPKSSQNCKKLILAPTSEEINRTKIALILVKQLGIPRAQALQIVRANEFYIIQEHIHEHSYSYTNLCNELREAGAEVAIKNCQECEPAIEKKYTLGPFFPTA